jgi:GT2 family glycosyltransferase
MTRKILLVFPVFAVLYPRPFQAFAELLVSAGRLAHYQFSVKVYERQALSVAMNDMGLLVLEQGYDAVIVFDDDCFPPVDVVERLLARAFDEDRLFVAAAGLMRGYPFTTTAAKTYAEGVTFIPATDTERAKLTGFTWIDDLPSELMEVDFCGVPAAIIRRECFERAQRPWFGELDERGDRVTHDVFFCRKLQAAGIRIYVDGTLRCGHLVEAPIVTFENREYSRKVVAGAGA